MSYPGFKPYMMGGYKKNCSCGKHDHGHHHDHKHCDHDFDPKCKHCKKMCDWICKCDCDCNADCSSVCDPTKNKHCFDPYQCRRRRHRAFPCAIRYCGTPCNFINPEDCEEKGCCCKNVPDLEETYVMLPLVQDAFELSNHGVTTSVTFQSAFPCITNPAQPYTFEYGGNAGSMANITNLSIEPIPHQCGKAKLKGNLSFPVSLTYTDGNNNIQTGTTSVTIPISMEIEEPKSCVLPYDAEVFVKVNVSDAPVNFSQGCIVLTMDVDWELYLVVTRPCMVYTDGSCNNVCEEEDEEEEECNECWRPYPYPGYACRCGDGCGGYGGYGSWYPSAKRC